MARKQIIMIIKEQDYTIKIYTNILDWARDFYGMPDGAILANEDEVSHECQGFAEIDTKSISIFVPKDFNIRELKETLAHEVGHIIELQWPANPEQIEENDELHEIKANYYADYYMLVDSIIEKILAKLFRESGL
jgi:hypothetical protein